jgi:hypothetical protein
MEDGKEAVSMSIITTSPNRKRSERKKVTRWRRMKTRPQQIFNRNNTSKKIVGISKALKEK